MALFKFRAPALPLPPNDYARLPFDEQARALRLYFNRLDGDLSELTGVNGGHYLSFPHIAASDSTDQIAAGNNTATAVKFNTLNSGSGWTLNAPGSATAEYSGVYKVTFRLQLVNSANAVHYATVWLKVNNVDATNSSTIFTVPARKSTTPGQEGFLSAYSEATFTINAGDEIELYWATDQAGDPTVPTDGVYMLHEDAQVSPFARPAIPSASGSITYVSALPQP